MRLRVAELLGTIVIVLLGTVGPAAPDPVRPFPKTIALPDGFGPEGIAVGAGGSFYAGSLGTGAVYRGDLRTGGGSVLIPGRPGAGAAGLEVDQRGRVFVAGAFTGQAFVYHASTASLLATYELGSPGADFINDVVVTADGAYFTDSFRPVIHRVPVAPGGQLGAAHTIPFSGDISYVAGQFNVNGIGATPDGKTLVIVQTNTGKLFTLDPSTGVTDEIELVGGDVAGGDGLLLDGKTLYVVQNFAELIARVDLAPDLSGGAVSVRVGDPDLDIPTTIAEFGDRLYAVNARFTTPQTPGTKYWVTQLRKP